MTKPDTVAELDRRFGVAGVASVVAGNGGLPMARIKTPQAAGEIYLHGAQVTSWKPADAEEVFFLSSRSLWEGGRAIRGGVPISFPWFADKAGDPKAPAHGFVRTTAWEIESVVQSDGTVVVSMFIESSEKTRQLWPGDFRLEHRVTVGAELSMELVVTNTGASSMRFEEALHSYHNVGHVEMARIAGLEAVRYLDKTDAMREKEQRGEVTMSAETDRVYLDTKTAVELVDPVLRRRIRIVKEHSLTTVVWNPWSQKAAAISDLGEGEWQSLLCIETSNVGSFAIELAPGQQHNMKASVSVAPLGNCGTSLPTRSSRQPSPNSCRD